MLKRLVCLFLLASMLMCGALAEPNYPDYINYDSCLPMINEGMGEDIVIKMAIVQGSDYGKWEDLWISKFVKEYFNVTLEVEQIPQAAVEERISLMFVAGDLPDLLINLGLSTNDIVMYGQEEGLLLKLDEYIDEKLTPNIVKRFTDYPQARALSTAPDGHIYSLPSLGEPADGTGLGRMNINAAWLEKLNMENPTTLDELMAVLYAMKEQDPDGVGAENVVPLGGGYESKNPGWYILNALGFVNVPSTEAASYGIAPAILDGECLLPCGTQLYRKYLKIMNEMYVNGLISANFFIQDDIELTGQTLNDYVGIYPDARVDTTGIPNWGDWVCVNALTSEQNPEAQWRAEEVVTNIGGFAVAASTKYPELCLKIADYYFSNEPRIAWVGPADGTEEAMGYTGRAYDSSDASVSSKTFDKTKFPAGIENNWSYLVGYLTSPISFGAIDMYDSILYYHVRYHGGSADVDPAALNPEFADHYFRISALETLTPYLCNGFPNVYYLGEEETYRLTELSTVIDAYVKEQAALFISGARSFEEFDSYLSELEQMGFNEYQGIYQKVWSEYLANS